MSLHTALKSHNKLYWGVATDKKHLDNPSHTSTLLQNFGQVTGENSMKWSSLHPYPERYTFFNADALVSLARASNLIVREHTLFWHRSLPQWVEKITDPGDLKSVIEQHIHTIVSHYAGQIYAWDVVNEVFNDNGTLRPNHFLNVLGGEYISIAFHAAPTANPSAKLYINDYMTVRTKISSCISHVT